MNLDGGAVVQWQQIFLQEVPRIRSFSLSNRRMSVASRLGKRPIGEAVSA